MTQDALLFVGYEEDSGTVLSVAGVTVMGIRGAYSPPIIAAKKKFGTADSSAYTAGEAAGRHYCEAWLAAGHRTDESYGPEGISEIKKLVAGKSADYQKGFYAGLENCAKAHSKGSPKFNEAYEHGRLAGQKLCRDKLDESWWDKLWLHTPEGLAGPYAPPNSAYLDWVHGFCDGLKEQGCWGLAEKCRASSSSKPRVILGEPKPLTLRPANAPLRAEAAPLSAPQPRPPGPSDSAYSANASPSQSMFNLAVRGW